jgi:predicted transcriptional regulator
MTIKKLSCNLDEELLERICKKSGDNMTYTVKSALKVYETLLDDLNQGKEIISRDKEGKEFYYKLII